MEIAFNFLHLTFVGFVALFPPVNPIGTALIVDPLLSGLDGPARRAASLRIAMYCLTLCGCAVIAGSWIFKLFGISLAVVQLAGGILICKMGWEFLSSDSKAKDPGSAPYGAGGVEAILFYPLAFPMTTGAGTISVLMTLSAHAHSGPGLQEYLLNLAALLAAIGLMAVLIYLSYAFTPALLRKLGTRGGAGA